MRSSPSSWGTRWIQALRVGVAWLVHSVVTDFILFVAIPHPFAASPYRFYVQYQPWVSLIYLIILASPWLAQAIARRGKRLEPAAPG